MKSYINKKELLFLVLVWLLLVLSAFFPFIFSFHWLKQGYIISGIHSLAHGDVNVYLSYLQQVADGKYLLDTLFTTENAMPMFRPFWLVLGLFGKVLHLSPLVTYYLGRSILSFILLLIIYIFIKLYFSNEQKAKIALLFISFTTGIGFWVAPLIAGFNKNFITAINWPIDMWIPEGFIFLSNIHSPHYLYSWSLLILIYFIWVKVISESFNANKLAIQGLIAGILGLFLFITHPFHVLPVYFTILFNYIFLYFTNQKKAKQIFNWLMIFGSLSFIGVYYHLYYLANDWLTAIKALQNITPSPNILMVLAGFILILPLGIWQAIKNFKNYKILENKWVFLAIWAVVNFSLIYSPVLWQRRMTQGLQIPLLLLSLQWFFNFWKGIKIKNKGTVFNYKLTIIGIVFFTMIPTSIYNVMSNVVHYRDRQELYYYSADFYQGLKQLRKLTDNNSHILSSMKTGNFIVGVAGRKIFVGHGVETAYSKAKFGFTILFFKDNKNDERKYKLLKQYHITHLFYPRYEKKLGSFNPRQKKYLKLIYQNPEVEIYEIL